MQLGFTTDPIFSTYRLDVLIHLAGTEINLKTNAFMRLVALSPNFFTSSLYGVKLLHD